MTPDDLDPPLLDDLPAADDTTDPLTWLWYGYLLPGDVSLFTSLWKMGKTTLLLGLLRALCLGGSFLGRPVRPGRVWVVSEESKQLWAERVRARPFGPHVHILARPFRGRPTTDEWSRLIDRAAAARAAGRLDLFVVDPLASFLPGRCESEAATLLEALQPLHRLTSAGVCVLLLHHPRKKPAEQGSTARGSGALLGFVDVTMELSRYSRLNSDAHRRRLFARSRRADTPARVDFEWDATSGEFRLVEEQPERQFTENWEAVLAVLREHTGHLTCTEMLRLWPEETERPGLSTLFRWLNKAHERKLVRRSGRGVTNNPWRYWLETDADRERDRLNEEFDRRFSLPPLPEVRGLWD